MLEFFPTVFFPSCIIFKYAVPRVSLRTGKVVFVGVINAPSNARVCTYVDIMVHIKGGYY